MRLRNSIIGLCLWILLFSLVGVDQAMARMVFSSDEGETNADVFILDADDSNSSDVQLQFGQTLGKTLRWDNLNSYFVFSDNLNIEGNISLSGTVDGIDVSDLANVVATHTGATTNPHQVSLEQARSQDNQILGNLDFNQNQATNLILDRQSSPPSTPAEGQVYYNTIDHTGYLWNGNQWINTGSGSTISTPSWSGSTAAVQVRRDTSFTMTNADTWYDVPLPLTDVETNTGAMLHDDTDTNRININETGLFLISYHLDPNDTGVTHTLQSRIMLNNASVLNGSFLENRDYQGEHIASSTSFLAELNSGDFISLQVMRSTDNELINETVLNIVKLEGDSSSSFLDSTGTNSDSYAIDQDNNAGIVELRFGSSAAKALAFDKTNDWFNLSDRLNIGGDGNLDGVKLTTQASLSDSEQNQIEVRDNTWTPVFSVDEDGDFTANSITTTATQNKYQFLDINGGINVSVILGTKADGQSPAVQMDRNGFSSMGYSIPVPDDWVVGTDILVEAFWSSGNTNLGNVKWDLDYTSLAPGEIVEAASFHHSSYIQATTGIDSELLTTSSNLTISASYLSSGNMLNLRFARDGGNSSDTYNGNANIHMIRLTYTGKKVL